MSASRQKTTVNADEVAQFDAIGAAWWDENGPMKPLHRLNPVRMQYLRDTICAHTNRDHTAIRPLKNLRIADIGCGGGLVTEPLCRMGAKVTGVDAGKENIKIARAHAKDMGLEINYKNTTVEELAAKGEKFDVVTALEIVEHVANPDLFIQSCCALLKENGVIIFSTLNRTAKSFALGIVAAEYILRWVPRGTHDWKKFMKPSEIARTARGENIDVIDVCGLVYSPVTQEFSLSKTDLAVNYFLTGIKK